MTGEIISNNQRPNPENVLMGLSVIAQLEPVKISGEEDRSRGFGKKFDGESLYRPIGTEDDQAA